MIEISGRVVAEASKITPKKRIKFIDKLLKAVAECKGSPVRIDLTDLDTKGLWEEEAFFDKLAVIPNVTLILDPKMGDMLKIYLRVSGAKANYEVRQPEKKQKKEDPRIQLKGEEYAKKAFVMLKDNSEPIYFEDLVSKVDIIPQRSFIIFKIAHTTLDRISSIGITAECIRRAIEIISVKASEFNLRLHFDVSDIVFEGGADIVLSEALVETRKKNKVTVKVTGSEGMAEYVRVVGNVRVPEEIKAKRFFSQILANTVLKLKLYRAKLPSDISEPV
jgi:hypothetical protein